MKLRVQGNSLRLRLTRSEVWRLRESGSVAESVEFGSGCALVYRIASNGATDRPRVEMDGPSITVHIPAESVGKWAETDEVGIYGEDGALRIAVEKDFRCLTRRPEELEADAYPHPCE